MFGGRGGHLEDSAQHVVAGPLNLKCYKQAQESWVQRVACTTRWPCCSNYLHVLDGFPRELLASVVETTALQELFEQRNGLLRAVCISAWHVYVIDKKEQPLAQRRTIRVLHQHGVAE